MGQQETELTFSLAEYAKLGFTLFLAMVFAILIAEQLRQ